MTIASRRGDLGPRPQGAERVDVADLGVAAGHVPPREPVADPEHDVQAGRRQQAEPGSATARSATRRDGAARQRAPSPEHRARSASSAARTASRGPRNVAANAAVAATSPTASGEQPAAPIVRPRPRSATRRRRTAGCRPRAGAERRVELGGLQVDHRDRPLLAARAELGGADDPDQQRQRQRSRAASPARSREPRRPARARCTRRPTSADVAVVGPFAPDPRRQRPDPGPGVLADVPPLVAVQDRRDEAADRDRHDERRRSTTSRVITKYEPTTISGPMSRNTSGTPSARNLYWNGGAV